ncbi:MAG: di-heme oxidoredictase family protein, partial [Pseudomonadota bacterium]
MTGGATNLTLLAVVSVCVTVLTLRAGTVELGDPHLRVVPRTAAESARIAAVLAPPTAFDEAEQFELRPGGAATSFEGRGEAAFAHHAANMPFERELDFKVGNGLFKKLWVSSPSSTRASDGLGPLYNARSCRQCHVANGRGHPPQGPDDTALSMLLRISLPGGKPGPIPGSHAKRPHPMYGEQIQDFSVAGVPAEARVAVEWEEREVVLSDGETVSLRRPTWRAENLAYGPLGEDAMLSPRVAPAIIGLGLLEAIPAADILAHADPDDADGDGISGRPSVVWSREFRRPMLGRFGLKATMPTLKEQSAVAFWG